MLAYYPGGLPIVGSDGFPFDFKGDPDLQQMLNIEAHAAARKYGVRTVTVTQTKPDMERYEAYRRKTAAFEEWRQKLNRGDRLPRGRFFKGKTPGRAFVMLDEFWQALG
ncbi:hypothetical protein [Pseudomonas fluorescens]|uniref:hypothetical protein n=1 Tax=Pseudomonas fluorescens TaxID=294 RepID=UPI001BED0528|nr:hypothetical protein [Pseudomonas fluorescens]MBT2375515.1 hypothetical protein [Pseudomonas fluorescens]